MHCMRVHLLVSILLMPFFAFAQTKTSDDLFTEARNAAFEQKNYEKAKQLAKRALAQSPDYTDVAIFLGRVYTWTDQPDSARNVFENILLRGVTSEDLFLAYASLEYWNDNNHKALNLVNQGLTINASSEDLLLLKSRILYAEKNYREAEQVIGNLLNINNQNTEARALAARISDNSALNAIGIVYNFVHFNKQFDDPWHLAGISYKRQTKFGSVIAKLNYANRFKTNGFQYELEAYPRISKMFYMYLNAGYSGDVGVFPKYRTGASLYANLPKSFEAEIGYRQLYFTDATWMYTASVGKYFRNFWFNFRTYLTPDNEDISQSYTFTTRYYIGGANDYFGAAIGTGISPDDKNTNVLLEEAYKLRTNKIMLEYNFSVKNLHIFNVNASFFRQEYQPTIKGNQLDIGISYQKRF
ncbi:YaiO family outer membrane beta-barrel protein [Olivibacter sp. LS-1]|uniref:YaiO family outer membrane beta-barrel protein n=1 Tax=Olivibacter sp. LS-1 TaxID=2592345 RepID=UPI001AEF8DE8|nr:YaiO family outer membrane beta-barrel protein [Olivibacter sp. LS-1]